MKLIVIRHGETELNRDDRLQGSQGPDMPLDPNGKRMVERLRDELMVAPEIMYVSPLRRTQETAHILNERFHAPIVLAPELRERDFGSLSGMKRSEIDQKLVENDLEGHYDYRPYGGESVDDVILRVRNFIGSIVEKPEEVVMLVTHRGVIRVLYDLFPADSFSEDIVPASKHIFEIKRDRTATER